MACHLINFMLVQLEVAIATDTHTAVDHMHKGVANKINFMNSLWQF